jgi:hypothetical protein
MNKKLVRLLQAVLTLSHDKLGELVVCDYINTITIKYLNGRPSLTIINDANQALDIEWGSVNYKITNQDVVSEIGLIIGEVYQKMNQYKESILGDEINFATAEIEKIK